MSGRPTSRYDTILKLASGGMATVWVGTARGALGFRQLVAVKKPHPHLLVDSYRRELVGEARLASLIHHANVVDVRDVVVDGDSISLIMDYIEGASVGELVVAASKRGTLLSPRVAVRIALDALAGLHAAHELVDERGRHVGLVHRDVSPQNILVGVDGLARVADFGVAKFTRNDSESTKGSLKGKLAYMAPEYLRGKGIDRRFDVFALGIVLWETLAGKRLFRGASEVETIRLILEEEPESLATVAPAAAALDGILKTALARSVEERFQNAQAMAAALESTAISAGLCGGHTEVATAVKDLVGEAIEERRTLIRARLANEPSLMSVMGGVAPAELVGPPTSDNLPSTIVGTPRLRGAARDAVVATPQPFAADATVCAQMSVSCTLPVTPRMEGGAVGHTLASTPTLASGTPAADPAALARAERSASTQLSFNDAPSARAMYTHVSASTRNTMMPVVAGVAAVILASAAIAFTATRTKHATAEPPPPAVRSAEASAAGSVAARRAPSASVPLSPLPPPSSSVAAFAPPAAASSAPARRRGAARGDGGSGTVTATGGGARGGTAPVAEAATTGPTAKKPPSNPYANE